MTNGNLAWNRITDPAHTTSEDKQPAGSPSANVGGVGRRGERCKSNERQQTTDVNKT